MSKCLSCLSYESVHDSLSITVHAAKVAHNGARGECQVQPDNVSAIISAREA